MTLTITSGATSPKPDGPSFLTEYSDHLLALYKMSARPLTSVAGTVNVVTATSATDFTTGGIVDGTKFTIEWAGTNTGAVTLNINSIGATPVIDKEGTALIAGSVVSGLRSLIEYVGGSFVILTEILASTAASVDYQEFTSSGTWTKPSGYDGNRMVVVEAWGGGGGGAYGGTAVTGGGGGGAYARKEFRVADMPSSAAVTIGAGGAGRTGSNGNGTAGGNTTIGALLTAYGGGGGGSGVSSYGGAGGGELAAGATSGSIGAEVGGGAGGSSAPGENASTLWGGGGGGSGNSEGGDAVFGGAGGGGGDGTASAIPGGVSAHGGNGGNGGDTAPTPTAGSAPGGGGGGGSQGNGGNGARGEVRVWIV